MKLPSMSPVVKEVKKLPRSPNPNCIYRLVPIHYDEKYYLERTDRNIGWITETEQNILKNSIVGIAGTGGMGGLLSATLLRAGVGEIRISDCESFDLSNVNRQFAATSSSVGKSKAFETARMLRSICTDSTLAVYPQGIVSSTVDHFIDGCSVICDEIEALAIDSRILLHMHSRQKNVSVFNCNTVGFSSNLFLYTPHGMTMEEALGVSYEAAVTLREAANQGDTDAAASIIDAILRAVVPHFTEYREHIDKKEFYARLINEGKVPIIATNPPMATGFLANRIILYLLKNSGEQRQVTDIPEMPGYLHIDTARLIGLSKKGTWFK